MYSKCYRRNRIRHKIFLKYKSKNNVLCRILSEDDLHLLEIPEPPTIISKHDSGGSSAITSAKVSGTKTATAVGKIPQQSYHPYSNSSIIFENDHSTNRQAHSECTILNEEKGCINNLKNIIHKLEIVSGNYLEKFLKSL